MIWASGVSKLKRNIWAGILALGVVVLVHVTDRSSSPRELFCF